MTIYSETYKNNVYDVDASENAKFSRLTERMLVAGENHSEILNWGHEYLQSECGVTMVLVKNHLKILNKIRLNQRICLKTWALPRVYPIITRQFLATDLDTNEPVWEASVECVLMDVKTRTIANGEKFNLTLPNFSNPLPEILSKPYRFSRSMRLGVTERTPDITYSARAEYSHLDYNGHLNSARYVEYIENALGVEYFTKHTLSQVDISYNEEIKPGEELTIKMYKEADGFYVVGGVNNKANFEAFVC